MKGYDKVILEMTIAELNNYTDYKVGTVYYSKSYAQWRHLIVTESKVESRRLNAS